MALPDAPAGIFEGEGELALIIGKTASHVPAAPGDGARVRLCQFHRRLGRGLPPPQNVFYQMKSRDTFAPIGPWIVTADEIADPQTCASASR